MTLAAVMDKDTFAMVDERPERGPFFGPQVVAINAQIAGSTSIMPAQGRAVALVDRSADIKMAARHIVRAKFHFKGRSPYAPDLVLVNEFAHQEFCQAVAKIFAEGHSSQSVTKSCIEANLSKMDAGLKGLHTTTIVSGDAGEAQLLEERLVFQSQTATS
jgi:acyl-CoA reductase-like NAD-dependent aldehyde dehydrogenase